MAIRELIKIINERKGNIVIGSHFIGRENLIFDLEDYFFCSKTGKNLTIHGLPRIGKTSLIRHSATLSRLMNEFDNKTIIVYIDLNADCRNETIDYVYQWIMIKIQEELQDVQKHKQIMEKSDLDELLAFNEDKSQKSIHKLQHFLKASKEKGITIRLILDEFDCIMKNCYKNKELNVQILNGFYACLRYLITDNEKYSLKVALISRNELSEMEPPGIESTLSGVCERLTMIPFNKKELNGYWKYLHNWDDEKILTQEYINKVESFTGGIPYWLDVVNNVMLHGLLHKIEEEEIEESVYRTIRKEYDSVIKMLGDSCYLSKSGTLKTKLLQLMVGPKFNLNSDDISLLVSYAIITRKKGQDGTNEYISLSPTFEEYLQLVPLEKPIWDSIFLFEQKMRKLLKEKFLIEYEGDWEKDFTAKYGDNNNGLIPKLRKDREKSVKLFGDAASMNLVDYLYMRDYYNYFIKDNWKWFQKVFTKFNGDIALFQQRISFLCDVRNPLAHSNGHFLTKDETIKADDYCKSFIEQIDKFME